MYQCPNGAVPSRKCSVKASAKWRNIVYVLMEMCHQRSKWLGPKYVFYIQIFSPKYVSLNSNLVRLVTQFFEEIKCVCNWFLFYNKSNKINHHLVPSAVSSQSDKIPKKCNFEKSILMIHRFFEKKNFKWTILKGAYCQLWFLLKKNTLISAFQVNLETTT